MDDSDSICDRLLIFGTYIHHDEDLLSWPRSIRRARVSQWFCLWSCVSRNRGSRYASVIVLCSYKWMFLKAFGVIHSHIYFLFIASKNWFSEMDFNDMHLSRATLPILPSLFLPLVFMLICSQGELPRLASWRQLTSSFPPNGWFTEH